MVESEPIQLGEASESIRKSAIHLLKGRAFYPVVFLLQLLLLVIGMDFGISTTTILVYILLPLGVASPLILNYKPKELDNLTIRSDPITRAICKRQGKDYLDITQRSFIVQGIYYFIGFWATYCVMLILIVNNFIAVGQVMVQDAMGLIILNVLLVSVSETVVFHGMIPDRIDKYLKGNLWGVRITYVSSQLMFALFHGRAFGWDSQLMFTSFIFGCFFLFIARKYGLATTMGVHACWNLCILGVISGGIMGI